jgi:DHA1 family multidrug resistance protein-like MFS transporter
MTTLRRKFAEHGKIDPEDRLPPMIAGAFFLPIGLFWFAWTSSPTSNPWPQILSGVPTGIGTQLIMLQSLAYIIDIYGCNANSAIAGTVIVRSFIAGLFPVLAIPLYSRLGVSSSTFQELSKLLTLFFFRYFGHQLLSD